jgi:hypothetical protein
MVYGYDSRTINEYGLKQMREISFKLPANTLRELARFLLQSADELQDATSPNWHRHSPPALERDVGCDVIVLSDLS